MICLQATATSIKRICDAPFGLHNQAQQTPNTFNRTKGFNPQKMKVANFNN